MEIGDSFQIDVLQRQNIGGYAANLGVKLATRTAGRNTIRVWRLK